MPGSCAVAGCRNTWRRNESGGSVSFHRFPRNEHLKEVWISRCGRKDSFSASVARVCSEHFDEGQYMRDFRSELLGEMVKARRILKEDAVPTRKLTRETSPVKYPGRRRPIGSATKRRPKALIGSADDDDKMASESGTPSEPVTTCCQTISAARASTSSSPSSADSRSSVVPEGDLMQPGEVDLNSFDYIRFTFADINGIARTKTVSKKGIARQLKEGVFLFAGCLAMGTRGDATAVEEATLLNYGNCVARAMSGTLRKLPWVTDGRYRVGEVLCETFWIEPFRQGVNQDACPRYLARTQLERLKEKGYALYSAFEPEFMLFKRGTLTPVIDGMDTCSSLRHSQVEEYACCLDDHLTQSRVKSRGFLVEHGCGQMEFSLEPAFGVETADQLFWFKETVKEMTLRQDLPPPVSSKDEQKGSSVQKDWQATFMAQPFPGSSNNGLHFNHSLWTTDSKQKNLFADAETVDRLSGVARHWVAGLAKHARALTALCCPTVNCYRRLFTPWAPEKNNWGLDDRFASFRVKTYGCKGAHVESRIPSGAANPYLVLAATVAAGLDGIANRLECPPPRGKVTDACQLPKSLSEAVDALKEDVWMRKSLGEEFIRWFVQMKEEWEIGPMESTMVLDNDARFAAERHLYFDLI